MPVSEFTHINRQLPGTESTPEPTRFSIGRFLASIAIGVVVIVMLIGILSHIAPFGEPLGSLPAAGNRALGRTAPSDEQFGAAPATGNKAHGVLYGMSSHSQAVGLGQIAGCTGESAFYMGMDKDKTALWSVRCAGEKSYEVAIEPDETGHTRVLACDVLKTVAHVDCFRRLDDQ